MAPVLWVNSKPLWRLGPGQKHDFTLVLENTSVRKPKRVERMFVDTDSW